MVRIPTKRWTFFVDVPLEYVADWIERDGYKDSYGGPAILFRWFQDDTTKEYVHVRWQRADNPHEVDFLGGLSITSGDGERKAHPIHVGSGAPLRFQLVQIAPERTEIGVEFFADAPKEVVERLAHIVEQMAQRWPEMRRQWPEFTPAASGTTSKATVQQTAKPWDSTPNWVRCATYEFDADAEDVIAFYEHFHHVWRYWMACSIFKGTFVSHVYDLCEMPDKPTFEFGDSDKEPWILRMEWAPGSSPLGVLYEALIQGYLSREPTISYWEPEVRILPLGFFRLKQESPGSCVGELYVWRTIPFHKGFEDTEYHRFVWRQGQEHMGNCWRALLAAWREYKERGSGEAETAQASGQARVRSGRPRSPDDDWAFEQIVSGRPQSEVFNEWRRRPGVVERDLAEPYDSFCKAMSSRRKKLKKLE